jgi:hypothetical protein
MKMKRPPSEANSGTIAAAVTLENGLDFITKRTVGELAVGRLGGVVVTAAGHFEHLANATHTVPGGGMDVLDHGSEFGWGLVPRMTAAFFKMSFSWRRRVSSRRRASSCRAGWR